MVRLSVLTGLFLLLSSKLAIAATISIVLDDMGNNLSQGQRALTLPGAVTYAFLPHTPFAHRLSREARRLDKESMVHLPMEALQIKDLGPGGLTTDMSPEELQQAVKQGIDSIPYAAGVNNHMGSLLTSNRVPMQQLMHTLAQRGDIYFVDSRTHEQTVAEQIAREVGVPSTSRDLFLDNVRDEMAIEAQFDLLLEYAERYGTAVAIGHPYMETLAVLERRLPELQSLGINLVPISVLIAQQSGANPAIVNAGTPESDVQSKQVAARNSNSERAMERANVLVDAHTMPGFLNRQIHLLPR